MFQGWGVSSAQLLCATGSDDRFCEAEQFNKYWVCYPDDSLSFTYRIVARPIDMNVLGYSERGILNALFSEMARSPDASGLLHSFLAKASFPFTQARPLLGEADVLVEQSFSDFGESDAVVLIRDREEKTCSVFVEAKVKTFQLADWHIREEFERFRTGLKHRVSSSNLFTQLYYKTRLVAALRQGGIPLLQQGTAFPAWSSKRNRKIGNNGVVLKATRLLHSHLGEVFYLAVVPDTDKPDAKLFRELETPPHSTLADTWDVSTYGYITWSQVRDFCLEEGLTQVLAVFDYNAGQLYRV
jgi:hypothetical protein